MATRLLHVCSLRYGVKVLAFGYGDFEGRWLVRPSDRRGLSCMMRDMQSTYSRYLNEKYNHRPCCAHRRRAGDPPCHTNDDPIQNSANWTARFIATEIDPEHIQDALRHIRALSPTRPRMNAALATHRRPARRAVDDAVQHSLCRDLLKRFRDPLACDARSP